MKKLSENTLTRTRTKILVNEDLRQIYYEEGRRRRAERHEYEQREAERAAEREQRRQALYARLGYTPKPDIDPRLKMTAAEAWMKEHPEEFNSETAPTRGALQRLVEAERLRMKATRERLREIGIR